MLILARVEGQLRYYAGIVGGAPIYRLWPSRAASIHTDDIDTVLKHLRATYPLNLYWREDQPLVIVIEESAP